MFGEEDSGVDYGKLKEDRRRDREDTRHIEQCFKLGVGNDMDKMLAIVTGQYRAPRLEGEPDKITAPIRPGMGSSFQQRSTARNAGYVGGDEQEDRLSYGEAPQRQAYRQPQMDKYADITDVLERFHFSDDAERRKQQMQAVATAVKTALSNLIPQGVAQNTKKAFSKYVTKFFKVPGGLQVVFAIGDSKYAITAKGAFYGDETLGLFRDKSDTLRPIVLRNSGGDSEDVSDQFDVSVTNYEGD